MRNKFIYLVGLLLVCWMARGQKEVTLSVDAGAYSRENCVVSADVVGVKPSDAYTLYESTGGRRVEVPFQLAAGKVYWILSGKTPAGTTRTFLLVPTSRPADLSRAPMKVKNTGKALILQKDDKKIMQYNYAVTYPPAGVDPAFRRSGYIHPLWSPTGETLTTIQPRDHYHHYGIWNPWTKLEYAGKIYDLWNLGDKKGTVRAKTVLSQESGNVYAGYKARLEHYIFPNQQVKDEKLIMDETWDVKAWNTPDGYLWDFTSTLHPCTSLPVLLKEYRYAGLGFRATLDWNRDNSEMVTSEGKTRKEIDGSTGRWIYVTGTGKTGKRSGVLFMNCPDNYNSPQPLRIWDEKANGRGDVFLNFAPTKNMDWKLMPGKNYRLLYRVFTYEGEMTKERAEALYNDFAFPPTVKVTVK